MKRLLIIPILLLTFFNQGCQEACDLIHDADMVTKSISFSSESTTVGSILALTSVIKNVAFLSGSCKSEDTRSSGTTNTGLQVYFQELGQTNSWQPTNFNNGSSTLYADTQDLSGEQETGFYDEFQFNDEGQYAFVGIADVQNQTDERDETNNENATDENLGGRLASPFTNIVIITLPKGMKKKPRKKGEPIIVNHISHKVLF